MGKQVRGAGVIRWGAEDGRSPYIGENGNWYQWNNAVKDYVDTGVNAKGVAGMPGQAPIQKEWIPEDTHRNDTNIVDFIYVRATDPADRKWYKLNDNYVTRTVPIGETEPSAATIAEYYVELPWLSTLALNILIAEEANLANFIFKEEKLISVRGTVDNVEVDYSGQANFIPNIMLDGKTGAVYFGAKKVMFNPDGSGHLANGNIEWDTDGNVQQRGKYESSASGIRIVIDPATGRLYMYSAEDYITGEMIHEHENMGGVQLSRAKVVLRELASIENELWRSLNLSPRAITFDSYNTGTGSINTRLYVEPNIISIIHGTNEMVRITIEPSDGTARIQFSDLPVLSTARTGELYKDVNGFVKIK